MRIFPKVIQQIDWPFMLYSVTQSINDTIPTYLISFLPGQYKESSHEKKTELTMEKIENVPKSLHFY